MSGLALVARAPRGAGERLRPRRDALSARAARGRDRAGDRPRGRARPRRGRRRARLLDRRSPERQPRARRGPPCAGLRELHRGDLLGEVTGLRPTIAVAGTHGKTTTTSMIVHALRAVGADPAYLIGGELRSTGDERRLGRGGMGRGGGRRVRPLVPEARAATSPWSPTSSSTTTRPTARCAEVERAVRGVPGRSPTRSCVGTGPSCSPWPTTRHETASSCDLREPRVCCRSARASGGAASDVRARRARAATTC